MAFREFTGSEGQSIYDVNLMYYSGFDNVVKFCKDNGINGLNDLNVSGKKLLFDTNLNSQLATTDVINNRGLVFVTGVYLEDVRITDDGSVRITDEGYLRVTD